MSVTRFADAVTALLTAYHAAFDPAGVPVYDGPPVTASVDPDFLIVGHDATTGPGGDLAATVLAGAYLQNWADLTTGRDETGTINCLIVSQTGDTADLPGRRARVGVLLAAAEDAAASAAAPHLTFDGTTAGRFLVRQSAAGAAVICAYQVAWSAPWGP